MDSNIFPIIQHSFSLFYIINTSARISASFIVGFCGLAGCWQIQVFTIFTSWRNWILGRFISELWWGYDEIGKLVLYAGPFVLYLRLVVFYFLLELGVGFEDGFQLFLEGLLLPVDPGGVGQVPSSSVVDKRSHLGVIEIAFSWIFFHHSSIRIVLLYRKECAMAIAILHS